MGESLNDRYVDPNYNRISENELLSNQLAHLGYNRNYKDEDFTLIKSILSDLELCMKSLKTLKGERDSYKAELKVNKIELSEKDGKLAKLRQENNSLRMEVINLSRKNEDDGKITSARLRELEINENRLKMANLHLKNSVKDALNKVEDERRLMQERILNSFKKTGSFDQASHMAEKGWINGGFKDFSDFGLDEYISQSKISSKAPPLYDLNLLETNKKRIETLEKHCQDLESRYKQAKEEYQSIENMLQARDLEINRLQVQLKNYYKSSESEPLLLDLQNFNDSESQTESIREKRLEDQIEYIQEYATRLENERNELKIKFDKEKSVLKNKLSEYKSKAEKLKPYKSKISEDFYEALNSSLDEIHNSEEEDSEYFNATPDDERSSKKIKRRISVFIDKFENFIYNFPTLTENNKSSNISNPAFNRLVKQLKENLEELKNIIDKNNNRSNSNYLNPKILEFEERVKELESQLKLSNIDKDNFKSLYQQVSNELSYERGQSEIKIKRALSRTKEELEESLNRLSSLREEMENKSSSWLLEKSQLNKKIESLESEISLERAEKLRADELNSSLKKMGISQERDFSKVELEATQNLLDSCRRELDELKTENYNLRAQISMKSSENSNAQFDNTQLRHDYNNIRKRYNSILGSYNQLTLAHEKLDRSLKKSMKDVDTWQ
ncbi:hypothetical protein AYI68_g6047 [Smittium mucronatum]|uniref:Uncharacterized protein n=1 Tax=Smittium mucronatum TaxID=133383 RepID=A0A1R0GSK2_9FUNG|nr:hypothetical protein AYI68_g6047 [Smittium mucronatum]